MSFLFNISPYSILCGSAGVVSVHTIPRFSKNGLVSDYMYSPPLSDLIIRSFFSIFFSTISIHLINISYTSDFCLTSYTHDYLYYSSVKLTKFNDPFLVYTRNFPHTYVCIISHILSAIGSLSFGIFDLFLFTYTQETHTGTSCWVTTVLIPLTILLRSK